MSSALPSPLTPSCFAISASSLGAGNFCFVHRAVHRASGVAFAVKVVDKAAVRRLASRDASVPQQLLQEKHVGGRVGAAVGPRLHATFQDAEHVFFVYDLVRGGELWAAAMGGPSAGGGDSSAPAEPRSPVPLDDAVSRAIVAWLCGALATLHARGIAHRDIKPENILLQPLDVANTGPSSSSSSAAVSLCPPVAPFTPCLIDWGTAKDLTNHPAAHNSATDFVGTPGYMPPEAINGGKRREAATPATATDEICGSDSRADLWSLACLAIRLVTGVTPFAAPSPYLSMQRTLAHAATCSDGGDDINVDGVCFAPGVSVHLEAFARALLVRDPAQRLGAVPDMPREGPPLHAGWWEEQQRGQQQQRGPAPTQVAAPPLSPRPCIDHSLLTQHAWLRGATLLPATSDAPLAYSVRHAILLKAAAVIANMQRVPLAQLHSFENDRLRADTALVTDAPLGEEWQWLCHPLPPPDEMMAVAPGCDPLHLPPTSPAPPHLWPLLHTFVQHRLSPTARLFLMHCLTLRRRTSLPHIFALFAPHVGAARCCRAVAIERMLLTGGEDRGVSLPPPVLLRRLGELSPREGLGWNIAPEAILRPASSSHGSSELDALAMAPFGISPPQEVGEEANAWGWRRVRDSSDSISAPFYVVIIAHARVGPRGISSSGAAWSADTDAGAARLITVMAAINRLSPPPRAIILIGDLTAEDACETSGTSDARAALTHVQCIVGGVLRHEHTAVLLGGSVPPVAALDTFVPPMERAAEAEAAVTASTSLALALDTWGAWLHGSVRCLFAGSSVTRAEGPSGAASAAWLRDSIAACVSTAQHTLLFGSGEGDDAQLTPLTAGGNVRCLVTPAATRGGGAPPPKPGGSQWSMEGGAVHVGSEGPAVLRHVRIPPLASLVTPEAVTLPIVRFHHESVCPEWVAITGSDETVVVGMEEIAM